MSLVHTAGTQTSQLRPSSFCWELHLLQDLKSHWWLLHQLLWTFSSGMPFILPKRMFLSCLIDVTHISEKTPRSSPARVRIIARSSMKQCSTPLALQKQQPFPRFMFQTELATQDAFLSLCWKRKGIRLENVHTRWLRWSPLWLFSSWSKWDSHQREDGLNQEVCVPAVHLKLPLLPLGSHREQFWALFYIVDVCKWPAQWTAFWSNTLCWWRTVVSYSRKRCKLRSTTERSAQIRGTAAPMTNWV